MKKKYIPLFICLLSFAISANAQTGFLPLSNTEEQKFQGGLNTLSSKAHTSMKPFLIRDLTENTAYDSLQKPTIKDCKFSNTLFGRKLFKEHLLKVEEDDYKLYLCSPL